jgi:hypothetical protein
LRASRCESLWACRESLKSLVLGAPYKIEITGARCFSSLVTLAMQLRLQMRARGVKGAFRSRARAARR